jgi:hypothetical protein
MEEPKVEEPKEEKGPTAAEEPNVDEPTPQVEKPNERRGPKRQRNKKTREDYQIKGDKKPKKMTDEEVEDMKQKNLKHVEKSAWALHQLVL